MWENSQDTFSSVLGQLGVWNNVTRMAAASFPVPYASWRLFQMTWSQGQSLKSSKDMPLAKELQLMHTHLGSAT